MIRVDAALLDRLKREHRFCADWLDWLEQRAEGCPDGAPDDLIQTVLRGGLRRDRSALVRHWMLRGGWREQVLFVMSGKARLWDRMAEGWRFQKCRDLARRGMSPWMLAALIHGAKRLKRIRDPLAFVASVIEQGHWIALAEEVERRERGRARKPLTNAQVLDVVERVAEERETWVQTQQQQ